MNHIVRKFVERTINDKLAKKRIKEAGEDHHKLAAATLFKLVLIPIRNSFVYVTETQMRRHHDQMLDTFESYVDNAAVEQLEADCQLDELQAFVKIFGDIKI